MEIIAHRGCGAIFPENTVEAVHRAAEALPAVEVDVRRCGTGELVCLHDETVDRVTNGTGRIADLTLAEARALEVQGSGEPIPTFESVVAAIPEGVTLQVELKETGLVADVLDTLASREHVRLSSFDPDVLEAVPAAAVPTGLLFRGDHSEHLALAGSLGCSNVHPHWRDCIESEVVSRAHEHGYRVYAWGIESDADAFAAVEAAGVDGATVDRPTLGQQ